MLIDINISKVFAITFINKFINKWTLRKQNETRDKYIYVGRIH